MGDLLYFTLMLIFWPKMTKSLFRARAIVQLNFIILGNEIIVSKNKIYFPQK